MLAEKHRTESGAKPVVDSSNLAAFTEGNGPGRQTCHISSFPFLPVKPTWLLEDLSAFRFFPLLGVPGTVTQRSIVCDIICWQAEAGA